MIGRDDEARMRSALRLARRGTGCTSPNPAVGAVLIKDGNVIGQGWHRGAGRPHAEVEALECAKRAGFNPEGSELYVTLEPCSTFGRTPPCTHAIVVARIARVVVAAVDPNPAHSGRGLDMLRAAGIEVVEGVLSSEALELNRAFNHWIVSGLPFVVLKAAMTLDGKIATASGASRWITSESSRRWAMKLRREADAILVGINTVLADDPRLTLRDSPRRPMKKLLRIVLDSKGRTPLDSRVISDPQSEPAVVVVGSSAPESRIEALARRATIWKAPTPSIGLSWLMNELGSRQITSLLCEGGGEIHGSFLEAGLANEIVFFLAPKVFGGRDARKGVAGKGCSNLPLGLPLRDVTTRRLGPDIVIRAAPAYPAEAPCGAAESQCVM